MEARDKFPTPRQLLLNFTFLTLRSQVLIIDRMKRIFNPSLGLYCDTRNAVPEDGITCRA